MTRSPVRAGLVVAVMALLGACGGSGGGSDAAPTAPPVTTTQADGRGDPIDDAPPAGPTTDLVTVKDPVNGAFSIDVPNGWDNLVYSTVEGQTHLEVVNSISPDGRTVIFIGDPKLPSYWNPDTADETTRLFADRLELMELRRYTPAPTYMPAYVKDKFGRLPGFTLGNTERDPEGEQKVADAFVKAGLSAPTVHMVRVRFSYDAEDGGAMQGILGGVTIDAGAFWQAHVQGLSTDAGAQDYLPMLSAMSKSQKTDEGFTAKQNARHAATMAEIQRRTEEMTRSHLARMQGIQISAQNHQARMQAMWDANDASVSSFYDRMASSDSSHRQFLNYINEENTVANSSGRRFQVDSSYQTYYMKKNDNTYVGGDSTFGETQMRELGLNPSDYEEVKIVK